MSLICQYHSAVPGPSGTARRGILPVLLARYLRHRVQAVIDAGIRVDNVSAVALRVGAVLTQAVGKITERAVSLWCCRFVVGRIARDGQTA